MFKLLNCSKCATQIDTR